MTMKHIEGHTEPRAADIDLQRHRAEDGTVYWSMIVGGEAIHIVRYRGSFVATSMHGQQIGATRTLAAATLCAVASLLRAA